MVGLNVEKPAPQERLPNEPFHEWAHPDGTTWAQFHRLERGYLIRFPGLADYAISGAEPDVSCRPAPEVSEDTLQHLYLNQVLPLVLSRRGKLVFHGSAVEVDNAAIAFLGESGLGKSTLAVSFAVQGHRLLADDGLVVDERDRTYVIQPSRPSIRLWEDSRAALLHPASVAQAPLSYTSKARFVADEAVRFCDEARRLRRLYFLGADTAKGVTLTELGAGEALIELVRHSFLLDVQAADLLAAQFDRLSRLVRHQPCFRLDYPRRFDALAVVHGAIRRHCAA